MSFNLLDLAKGYLTDAVVGKLAGNLGEDSSVLSKAVGASLPALLGGIINSSSSPSGLSGLMNVLSSNKDHSLLDDLGGILGDSEKSNGMMSMGGSILNSLLGDKLGGVVSAVSSFTGLGSGSTSSLFSFLAPVVTGILGKKVASDGLGISGLGDLLGSQKSLVSAALPSGLSSALGLGNLMSSGTDDLKSAASSHIPDVETGGFNWKPWLLGLLALLAAFLLFRKCSAEKTAEAVEQTTEAVSDTLAASTDTVASAVSGALDKLGASVKRALPDGVELNVPENGIESNLIGFINDASKKVDKTTWFNFDRINFATGSSELTAESAEQVNNIAAILKAFPKVNLKIGGYTDNTGNAKSNLKLSANRATTVMKAIVANGIDAGRLAAEGYGDQHPEASNDTEEGRAQNRRIAVRVTEK
jgi:OmpA-OmpF porin, OOP family